VVCRPCGSFVETSFVREKYKDALQRANIPDVTFHSLRGTSTTVKLVITGGNIKAVQGDTGHAQAQMVTNTYAAILDDSRKVTAKIFDENFYEKQDVELENLSDAETERLINKLASNEAFVSKLLAAAMMSA